MAEYLASIYGTEKDKVNCTFYFKIGACRHGERCSRKHVKPTFSPTVLVHNVYINPSVNSSRSYTEQELQAEFDIFYEDFFIELAKYGPLEEMHVCDNVGDHLVGNVYARFCDEFDAGRCVDELNQRYYDKRPLYAELSPVTDFREACCRQHEATGCNRGGFCNFMHVRHPTSSLRRDLLTSQKAMLRRSEKQAREQRSSRSLKDQDRDRPPADGADKKLEKRDSKSKNISQTQSPTRSKNGSRNHSRSRSRSYSCGRSPSPDRNGRSSSKNGSKNAVGNNGDGGDANGSSHNRGSRSHVSARSKTREDDGPSRKKARLTRTSRDRTPENGAEHSSSAARETERGNDEPKKRESHKSNGDNDDAFFVSRTPIKEDGYES